MEWGLRVNEVILFLFGIFSLVNLLTDWWGGATPRYLNYWIHDCPRRDRIMVLLFYGTLAFVARLDNGADRGENDIPFVIRSAQLVGSS